MADGQYLNHFFNKRQDPWCAWFTSENSFAMFMGVNVCWTRGCETFTAHGATWTAWVEGLGLGWFCCRGCGCRRCSIPGAARGWRCRLIQVIEGWHRSSIRKLPRGPGCTISSSHHKACGYRHVWVLQQISMIPHKKQVVEDPNHPQFVFLLCKNLRLENPCVSCCRCARHECPSNSLSQAARGWALHLPTNFPRVEMMFFCSCASEPGGNLIISVCNTKTSWLPRELRGWAAKTMEAQALLLSPSLFTSFLKRQFFFL